MMAKSPNRSVSILLRRQLSIYLIQIKGVSATVLPTRTMRSILRFLGVQAKCNGSESFCCRVQSDFNLINLPWKCAGKDNAILFLFVHWLSFFLPYSDHSVRPFFLTEQDFILSNAVSGNVKYTDLSQ